MIDFKESKEKAYEYNSKHNSIRILPESEKPDVGLSYKGDVWEIKIDIPLKNENQREATVYLLLDQEFPLTFPRAYLSMQDYESMKYLPHVDTLRTICFVDDVLSIPDYTQPEFVIRDSIKEIREVLRKGLEEENLDDFSTEFLAYWEGIYPPEEKLLGGVYSIIGKNITGYRLGIISYEINKDELCFTIHSFDDTYIQLKEYLKSKNIIHEEFDAFYIETIDISLPPFNLSNKELIDKIKALGDKCFNAFKKYINNEKYIKFIVFNKKIRNTDYYLGWVTLIDPSKKNRPGFRPGSINNFDVFSKFDSRKMLQRIFPKNMTKNRIELRSKGTKEEVKYYSFLVAGLGSVGSNLIHFLNSMPVKEYMFIDNERLELENTGRHLLGYSSIGKAKATAMRDFIYDKQPVQKVTIRETSIINVISAENALVNEYDYLFIALGRFNQEKWISDQQAASLITKPIFYIWVEPYLAGGHILYIHPEDNKFNSFFDDEAFFKYTIISKKCYETNEDLKLIEAGCQYTFTPYSIENVVGFLSAAFPQIRKTIRNNNSKSWSLTWVGDLESLTEMGFELSEFGTGCKTGSIMIF